VLRNMLADLMKERTWVLHKEAERTGVVSDMLNGRLTQPAYLCYIRNLLPIYQSLEARPTTLVTFPQMQDMFDSRLFRSDSLSCDINEITKTKPWKPSPIFECTDAYCAAINTAHVQGDPKILGHIYVRYLGDLNGGQVLKRLIAKHLNLPNSQLTFYEFPLIDTLVTFRTEFRNLLNGVRLSEIDQSRAIQGAIDAFAFNIDLSKCVKEFSGS